MIDVHIRLQIDALNARSQVHLYSQFIRPESDEVRSGSVSGLTEWSSEDGIPALSFSWDWSYDRRLRCIEGHWDTLRTNLRLVDAAGEDLGDECVRVCVARLMNRHQWERQVADALALDIAARPAHDFRH